MVPARKNGTRGVFPLVRWHENVNPLPVRIIRAASARATWSEAAPWVNTGLVEAPFDFCGHVRRLLADIVARCEGFGHIQVPQILLGVTLARSGLAHGLQARVTPLRFAAGQLRRQRRGVTYQVQRFFLGDTELLYFLTFCLPRFLDQDFDAKFITLFHELYHIGPSFDGDLRRHDGRYALHSRSQRAYDRRMAEWARKYLAGKPDPELHSFLRLDFAQLQQRHGGVWGIAVPRPKILPVAAAPVSPNSVV